VRLAVCGSALGSVWLCGSPAVGQCVAEQQCAVCGSLRQCDSVRQCGSAAVCGSSTAVCGSVRAAVCSSACGGVRQWPWQCAAVLWQCAAVRLAVYGCLAVRQCAAVRQCTAVWQCAAMCGSAVVYLRGGVWHLVVLQQCGSPREGDPK
jgi:hypothetical protein